MLSATQLKRVLVDDVIIVPQDDAKHELVLREVDAEMTVTVVGDSTDMVAVRMSTDSRRIGLLKEGRGKWNLICDYILFGRVDSTWHAVLVELKKTFRYDSHPKEQLRWSLPVLHYIRQTCELEFEKSITMPQVSYAILVEKLHQYIDKQPMSGAHSPLPVEKWKGISIRNLIGHRFEFRDLIGNQ